MDLRLEQQGKQLERVHRILTVEDNIYAHPYCDKNDSHWFSVASKGLRSSSGAFDITRNAQVVSYYNDGNEVTIGETIGTTTIFSLIAPHLISFAGVLGDKAYLFSRPLEITQSGLVFPSLEDLKNGDYSINGLYFPIREITAYDDDMERIVKHFNSF